MATLNCCRYRRAMSATAVFVPGRVNILGEHTDYNDGLALPFAIDFGVTATARDSDGSSTCVTSDQFGTWCDTDQSPSLLWTRLAHAVLSSTNHGPLTIEVASTIPPGAGLSSSAAFVAALALATGARGDARTLAIFVRDCEIAAGSDVGLLDPVAVLAARAGHALLIDFATVTWRDVPVPVSLGVTVVHSGVSRALADTAYARRREECRAAQSLVTAWPPSVRDADTIVDPELRRRARHVATENERVRAAEVALGAGDLDHLGALVDASHASLRDDFAVSLPAIDDLVAVLRSQRGVLGARVMGGGFGGCVLALHHSDVVVDSLGRAAWRVHPADGALARRTRS